MNVCHVGKNIETVMLGIEGRPCRTRGINLQSSAWLMNHSRGLLYREGLLSMKNIQR